MSQRWHLRRESPADALEIQDPNWRQHSVQFRSTQRCTGRDAPVAVQPKAVSANTLKLAGGCAGAACRLRAPATRVPPFTAWT
jgi:hypothetical protein